MTVHGSCTNGAGLSTDADDISMKIDKTAPTAVLSAAGTLGLNGWYTSNVTVSTTGVDAISGVTCSADQTQTTDTTGTVFNGSCINGAGTTTNAVPLTVKRDTTAPVVTLTTPPEGASYLQFAVVNSNWTATDATSGIASTTPAASGVAINTSTTGAKTFTVSATDLAGNNTSVTHNYSVYTYVYGNLQAPLSISTKDFKQMSTIPVKFQLLNSITHLPVQGPVATLKINGVNAQSSGGSNVANQFRYDTSAQQYIYNLSTKSLSTGANTLAIHFASAPPSDPAPVTITIK